MLKECRRPSTSVVSILNRPLTMLNEFSVDHRVLYLQLGEIFSEFVETLVDVRFRETSSQLPSQT